MISILCSIRFGPLHIVLRVQSEILDQGSWRLSTSLIVVDDNLEPLVLILDPGFLPFVLFLHHPYSGDQLFEFIGNLLNVLLCLRKFFFIICKFQ